MHGTLEEGKEILKIISRLEKVLEINFFKSWEKNYILMIYVYLPIS